MLNYLPGYVGGTSHILITTQFSWFAFSFLFWWEGEGPTLMQNKHIFFTLKYIKIFHDNKIWIRYFKLSKRQSLLPTTVLLRTTLIRTIKVHFYIYSNVILNPKGSNNLLYFKLRSSIPSCRWRIIWFQTSGRYKYTNSSREEGSVGVFRTPSTLSLDPPPKYIFIIWPITAFVTKYFPHEITCIVKVVEQMKKKSIWSQYG